MAKTLTELAQETGCASRSGRRPWYDLLPPEIRKQVFQLREDYLAGKIRDATAAGLHRMLKKQVPHFTIGLSAFQGWIFDRENKQQ